MTKGYQPERAAYLLAEKKVHGPFHIRNVMSEGGPLFSARTQDGLHYLVDVILGTVVQTDPRTASYFADEAEMTFDFPGVEQEIDFGDDMEAIRIELALVEGEIAEVLKRGRMLTERRREILDKQWQLAEYHMNASRRRPR